MIQLSPIAITATGQQYLTNVTENLCQAYCLANQPKLSGTVTFSLADQQTVSTETIVTINAAIAVTYTPISSCKSVVKQFTEQFQVAFIGTAGAVPTIALTPLTTVVSPENIKCNAKAYGVSLATPLTIAATFPS